MGKRHRRKRKWAKILLFRKFKDQYKETELGELQRRYSKAEARALLANRLYYRWLGFKDILDVLQKKATEDLQAIEDEAFIAMLRDHDPTTQQGGEARQEDRG